MKAWKETVRRLPLAGAFFLLSLAECFSVPSPYAICCLGALIQGKVKPLGAGWGLGAAVVFRLIWGMELDIWQYAACVLCWPVMGLRIRGKWQIPACTLCLLLLRALPGMMVAEEWQTIIRYGAGILLGMASMPALCRGARVWAGKKEALSEDDLLCLLLPVLLLIAGAGRLWIFEMNAGYLAANLMVQLLCWMAGGAVGICAGMGCGLALLLGGQSALMMVNLTFGALIGGLFQGKSRMCSLLGFLLAAATSTYLSSLTLRPMMLLASGIAGGIFLLLPQGWIRKMDITLRKIRWARPRENAYTRIKMQRWVRAIDAMADALPAPRIQPVQAEAAGEAITESLCKDCQRLPICWHEEYDQTKAAMMALVERNGEEDVLDVINRHFTVCPRISQIPPLLEKMDEEKLRKNQRALCAEYERDMLQTHLAALSQAAQTISLEGMQQDGEEEYWIAQAEEGLQAMHFPGQTAFVKRVDGRMTVCLKYEPLSLRPSAGDQLVRQLSIRLQAQLQITEQGNGRILLEEEPPLILYTGMATICAAPRERRSRALQPLDNGDAVLSRTLSGGKMLLALSDGMGHGAGAREESKKTLELLSLCMEAGYTRSQAMMAVNGAMLSATGGEQFATVDLCLIDLWTGEAAMNKLGACASVLLMGQKMEMIEGEALPLGIIEHVIPMEHCFTLAEGDTLLMMSDGVADAFEKEEDMLSLLRKEGDDTPQHIADALLEAALSRHEGLPPDDMTVLCARVALRHTEKHRSAME